jgi:hypothetical protein
MKNSVKFEKIKVLCALRIFVLFMFVLLLNSCKKFASETPVEEVFQSYYLEYDESKNETYVQVVFTNSKGKKIILDGNSKITCNGELIPKNGKYYSKTFNGNIDTASFKYIDINEKEYLNELVIPFYISNDNSNILSKSISSYWVFNGTPIGVNEEVKLYLELKNKPSKNISIKNNQLNGISIYISSNSLNKFDTTGITIAQTSRSYFSNNGQWTNAGGELKSVYKSLKNEIIIIP